MHKIDHPSYGPLTIGDHLPGGRSRECVKEDGTKVVLSSKALNKLARLALGNTPVAPEEFVLSVKLYLDQLTGPVQDRTARDVWAVADGYLVAPKLEAVGT